MLVLGVDRTIAPKTAAAERGVHRVLVAFDGSAGAWAALDRAIALAASSDAELTIAAVAATPRCIAAVPGAIAMPYSPGQLQRDIDGELRRHLAEARDEVPATVRVTTRLLHGRAARELATLAETGRYDLLVTGPRAAGRLRRRFGGSVTHALLSRCKVSVLAVKSG